MFAVENFKCICLNKHHCIFIKISLSFDPRGPIDNFLHDRLWISSWIKSISNELDITSHMFASQLSGHCDVIANGCHQQNVKRASETRGLCVNILVLGSFMDSLCRGRNEIMYVLLWRTVYALTRVLFWCLFPLLLRNEINTKITLLWAHKQFATRVHTLFSINRHWFIQRLSTKQATCRHNVGPYCVTRPLWIKSYLLFYKVKLSLKWNSEKQQTDRSLFHWQFLIYSLNSLGKIFCICEVPHSYQHTFLHMPQCDQYLTIWMKANQYFHKICIVV